MSAMLEAIPLIRSSLPLERMPTHLALGQVEPFLDTPRDRLSELAQLTVRRTLTRGQQVVRQGAPADGLHIVLRGRVHRTRALDATRTLIVASLGPGEVFGEDCVCKDARASTNAVCATPAELLYVPAAALTRHMLREPEALLRLISLQSRRLHEIEGVASQIALCAVEERLAHRLVQLADHQNLRSTTEDGWVVTPLPTRAELARMIGTCRETVSRALGALARNGLICVKGRRMIVREALIKSFAT